MPKPAYARAFLWGCTPPPVSQPRPCGARARDHLRFRTTRPLYAGHAAVSRDQGPLPEHARPLSHGGLLRDVLRGRRARQPPDRHHAHEAREGPRRHPHSDGGRPLHDARSVHRASRAPRRIGRGGRAAGHARQRHARAQDLPHRHARNTYRYGASPAKERLGSPFRRPARAARPALGLCVADAQQRGIPRREPQGRRLRDGALAHRPLRSPHSRRGKGDASRALSLRRHERSRLAFRRRTRRRNAQGEVRARQPRRLGRRGPARDSPRRQRAA